MILDGAKCFEEKTVYEEREVQAAFLKILLIDWLIDCMSRGMGRRRERIPGILCAEHGA